MNIMLHQKVSRRNFRFFVKDRNIFPFTRIALTFETGKKGERKGMQNFLNNCISYHIEPDVCN